MTADGDRPAEEQQGEPVRILILEDVPADAELAERQLRRAGLRFTAAVAAGRDSFEQLLGEFGPDVILADFRLPGFSGEGALKIAQERCPQVPFIFLSGVIGDEAAAGLIRQGATDFVSKDRPARLPMVVQRALAETAQRSYLARLEAQLRRSERLATVGRLAAGVAHEFNNQVGAIVNYATFIREEAERWGKHSADGEAWQGVRRDATQIEDAGSRVIRLVHQLLAAGGQQAARSETTDLNQLLQGIQDVLRTAIGEHISLSHSPAPRLWPVAADPRRLREVVLALALNAAEAMPEGGTLSITTANVTLGEEELSRFPGLAAGEYVRLAIADTGTGMEPDVLEHAFEPFFSTKPFAQGGGLGLSTVYGIVTQFGGHVDISSVPGGGTTVTVWLPRQRRPPPPGGE